MREFNGFRIRGSNPSHYNCTPNAILPDDLVTHLLKYYGHIVMSDKYATYDNKVLNYESVAQLSLPGNSFDLSLAEMGLKHTSFYNKIMDYLKENIYISSEDLKETESRTEVSEKIHKIVGKIKEKMEELIRMQNENNSLTPYNGLESENERLLKEIGALLYQYDLKLQNAQRLSHMMAHNHGCGFPPPPPPPQSGNQSNSIMSEIVDLKAKKMDTTEAINKFALKEAIPDISNLASKNEVSDALSKSAENVKKEVLRNVGEIYQEKVSSGTGIKLYNEHEIAVDTKVIASKEYVDGAIDAAKIAASGQQIDLTSYAKKVDVEKKADQVEVDKKISKEEADRTYASRNDLQYKANSIDLDYKLDKDEAKKTYATKKEIPDISDRVVYEDLDKVKYVLERAINKKADQDALSGYATTGDLATKMDKGLAEDIFARKNDLNSKVNKVDLNSYATKEEVISRINEAKLSGDGKEVDLSIYATKGEVTRNITSSEEKIKAEVYNSISGKLDKVTAENTYAKQSDIPAINHLATKDELTKAITDASTNYVSKVSYEIEKANFADKEEVKVKLDKTEASNTYATKEALDIVDKKVDAIVVPSIDGLAKAAEVVSKVDYAADKATFALSANVVNNETYTADKATFATKEELNNKANSADIPDVSNLATKDELNAKADSTAIPDVSKFITSEKVDEKIAQAQLGGGGTDVSTLVTKEAYEADKATFALSANVVSNETYTTDKATFATKEELNNKADTSAIPSIDGLAKTVEVVAKTDYDKDKATFALSANVVSNETYTTDKATFATKEELNNKADTSAIPSIDGLAKTVEVVAKTDYDKDKATFALSANVVSNETYTADKETFALTSALEELTTKYTALEERLKKLEIAGGGDSPQV